jgi:hypothetical protein
VSSIFLVRLRRERRYIEHIYQYVGKRRVERHPESHVFSTKTAAEQFALTALPSVNPFRLDYGLEDGEIGFRVSSYPELQLNIPKLTAAIEAEGLAVPEWWKEDAWIGWWEQIRQEHTSQELVSLQIRLGLPNWSGNPFHGAWIGSWPDTIHLDYHVPYQTLYELAKAKALPEMPSPEVGVSVWELWWDETAPRMTDAQKAALWRLLDPQPWEIVEVELESER